MIYEKTILYTYSFPEMRVEFFETDDYIVEDEDDDFSRMLECKYCGYSVPLRSFPECSSKHYFELLECMNEGSHKEMECPLCGMKAFELSKGKLTHRVFDHISISLCESELVEGIISLPEELEDPPEELVQETLNELEEAWPEICDWVDAKEKGEKMKFEHIVDYVSNDSSLEFQNYTIETDEYLQLEIKCPCGNICAIEDLEVFEATFFKECLCPECREYVCSVNFRMNPRFFMLKNGAKLVIGFSKELKELEEAWPEIKEWDYVDESFEIGQGGER